MNRFARCVVACACSAASLAAQSGWSLRTPPTPLPPARYFTQLAFDLGRGVTVMFGGFGLGQALADTWEWNGSDWTQRQVSGPSARWDAAFGCDPTRQRVVMFGGRGPAGLLADTWEYDGASWTQFAVPGPSPRQSSAIANDPTSNRMLLFGGGARSSSGTTLFVYADTWAWDGATWQLLAPAHVPPARWSHGLATDFFRQRIVLHGGTADWASQPATQTDTWVWNGSDWSQLVTAANPGALVEFGFEFDWAQGVMVMFGGEPLGPVSNTWVLDGDVWIHDMVATGPARRFGCSLASDATRGRTVMFGGYDGAQLFAETWEYSVPPVARWIPHGVGCAGTAGVPLLASLPAARPVVGGTFGIELTNVLDGPVLFATGFSTTTWLGASLPAPLDALGMPGCTLYGSVDMLDLVTATLGRATLSLPVPNLPSLVGITFVNQALAADPGVNAFGAVVSNAGIGTIGAL